MALSLASLSTSSSKLVKRPCSPAPLSLSDAGTLGEISFVRKLLNYDLLCREELDQVEVGVPNTQEQCKTLLYAYSFITSDDIAETLSSFYTSGFYAWDSCVCARRQPLSKS